jgi:glycerate 2-kinase
MTTHIIKNYDQLNRSPRHKDALDIIEAAYEAIDSDLAIRRNVRINDNMLSVKNNTYDLDNYDNLYVVGCGKVACQVATTLEDILGDHIKDGAVVGIKDGTCKLIEVYTGTHPMPSDINFQATQKILAIGEHITEKDLVIAVIGGGGSALLCASQSECNQGQLLYTSFLDSGGQHR